MRAWLLPRAALLGALLAAQLSLAPSAGAAVFDDDVARARIQELRQRFEAYQKSMDERLARMEASGGDRRAILDLAGQIDAMRGDLAKMRGQVEVLLHQLENSDKRQKDLYVDIDTRLRKFEQVKETAAAPGGKPASDTGAVPEPETRAYEAALNQFKLGAYPLAISAFQGFLVTYPSSKLAPSAQYWIGNAHYAQRDYKQAIAAQQRVLSAWPDDAKAPDAMLNMASSQEAMGDRRGAQKTLEGLVARYPGSPAAASAKQRLTPPAAAAPAKR